MWFLKFQVIHISSILIQIIFEFGIEFLKEFVEKSDMDIFQIVFRISKTLTDFSDLDGFLLLENNVLLRERNGEFAGETSNFCADFTFCDLTFFIFFNNCLFNLYLTKGGLTVGNSPLIFPISTLEIQIFCVSFFEIRLGFRNWLRKGFLNVTMGFAEQGVFVLSVESEDIIFRVYCAEYEA